MKAALKSLSELVAKANDAFYAKHQQADTLMGIMDNTLRQQGLPADAVTLDWVALDKKMVFLLHDDAPGMVSIAMGNKAGDIYASAEHNMATLTEATVVSLLETHFGS
ncbi:hypothetical protein VT06_01510 [Arsukibacterium sp. MJ3]|jgi:hypothetical protein|uniref:hypothetical protein n=1 Tax=Arsukibacterium sp. MJ3 TaxID=1632859 RepID=UPI0006273450|nr:hypothetical protein [Arsukibacterium sp. MJ3]KKO50167.1 hypothetical protein VT06_01510 [Arsukibacterium sp. MJ3]